MKTRIKLNKAIDSEELSTVEQLITANPQELAYALYYACRNGKFIVAKYLIKEKNADPHVSYTDVFVRGSMLKFAAVGGNLNLVTYLVETCHVEIEAIDQQAGIDVDDIALSGAARNGHDAVVQYFISKDVDVNPPSSQLFTVLTIAVFSNKLSTVQLLGEAGAAINRASFHHALKQGNLEIARYFCQKKTSIIDEYFIDPWMRTAVKGGNVDLIKYLEREHGLILLTGCFSRWKDPEYEILVAGTASGSVDMMRYLIDERKLNLEKFKQKDEKEYDANYGYSSILGRAIGYHKSIAILKYLLEEKNFIPSNEGMKKLLTIADHYTNIVTKAYLQSRLEADLEKKSLLLQIVTQGLSSLSLHQLFELRRNKLLKTEREDFDGVIQQEIDKRPLPELIDVLNQHPELLTYLLFYYAQSKFAEDPQQLLFLLSRLDKPLDEYLSPEGETLALFAACSWGNRYNTIVKELVARDTDIDKPANDGRTLLSQLSSREYYNENFIPEVLRDSQHYTNTLIYACKQNKRYSHSYLIRDLLQHTKGKIGATNINQLVMDAMASGNLCTLLKYVDPAIFRDMRTILGNQNVLQVAPQLYENILCEAHLLRDNIDMIHQKGEYYRKMADDSPQQLDNENEIKEDDLPLQLDNENEIAETKKIAMDAVAVGNLCSLLASADYPVYKKIKKIVKDPDFLKANAQLLLKNIISEAQKFRKRYQAVYELEIPSIVSPVPTSLIEQVISKATQTFVNGSVINMNAIRAEIKDDIKKEIIKTYTLNYTPEQFDEIFEKIYAHRIQADRSITRISEPETYRIDISRLYIKTYQINLDKKLAKKFKALTPEMKEKLQAEFLVAKPAPQDLEMDEDTPRTFRENFDKKYGPDANKELYAEFKEQLSEDLTKELAAYTSAKAAQISDKEDEEDDYSVEEDSIDFFYNPIFRKDFQQKFKYKMKAEIKSELTSNLSGSQPKRPTRGPNHPYYVYEDPYFPRYDANWIAGTNFIATEGPRQSSLATFLEALLFSENREQKPAITKIIGLGTCLKEGRFHDFSNYSFDDRTDQEKSQKPSKTFLVEDKSTQLKYQCDVTNKHASSGYSVTQERHFPEGFVLSHLAVTDLSETHQRTIKEIDTMLIAIHDGGSLNLQIDNDENQKLKEVLWQVSQESKNNAVAIHCMGGIGRTGHIILTLEILKDYKRIFSSADPELINNEIESILNRMRLNRVALVEGIEQYLDAIRNAHIIYSYAFEKKYMQDQVSHQQKTAECDRALPSHIGLFGSASHVTAPEASASTTTASVAISQETSSRLKK